MRSVRLRPIVPDDLDHLPSCPIGCPNAGLLEDAGWIDATMDRLGTIGVQCVDHGRTVGHLLLATSESLPGKGLWATALASSDVLVLIKVRVDDHERGHGVGRQMVQSAAALAVRHRSSGLEAIGSYGPGTCAAPAVTWLRRTGFEVTHHDLLSPRLRLELRQTVRPPRRRSAWAAWKDLLRPLPPEPASRTDGGRLRHDEMAEAGRV